MKKCPRCQVEKELSDFANSKARAHLDGVTWACKECNRIAAKAWREKNSLRRSEYVKEHYKNNREYFQQWRDNNKDKQKENHKLWYAKNKQIKLTRNKEWAKNNPEYGKKKRDKRRMKLFGNDGRIEKVLDIDIFQKTNGGCHICSSKIDLDIKFPDAKCFTIDHKIPLSKGGEHTFDNLWPAHFECNVKKGANL